MRKIAMDGTGAMNNVTGLDTWPPRLHRAPRRRHRARCLWNTTGMDAPNSLVERSASGPDDHDGRGPRHHLQLDGQRSTPNAIHYYQSDDSYTISDRNVNLFVKVKRSGQLVWQLGGSSPKGQAFTVSGGTWMVNHGHHLLPNGNFLFFSNGAVQRRSAVAGAGVQPEHDVVDGDARLVDTQASGVNSAVLSDAQRLPNGNTLVTFSVGRHHPRGQPPPASS